uniref:Adenylate kinase active site lid domain-containing protein n=1 Tax=Hemiselmis andersenii TaxID=464988 RepID=A0A7S1MXB8_HEMAN|mmetsp:Transcript_62143/g.149508  ORF Transcript_62143/g.149508 Transcript_62143/m.149508 type:complete len:273 (+) Transcript_62143:275-1093(+)
MLVWQALEAQEKEKAAKEAQEEAERKLKEEEAKAEADKKAKEAEAKRKADEEARLAEERRNRPVMCAITGPPGSIKGKLCELIVAEVGCKHVSVGEATRHAVQNDTPAGRRVQEAKKEGQAVTDELSTQVVVELVTTDALKKSGWILDGLPRNTEQAAAMGDAGVDMAKLVVVDISDDDLVKRAVGRRMDLETHTLYHLEGLGFPKPPDDAAVMARLTQRKDDTSERVLARLDQYRETNQDVSPSFREVLRVDGTKEPSELTEEIKLFLRPP